jgi:hypothetical protein
LHDLISEGAQEKSWKFRILDQTCSIGASTTIELYTFGMIILSLVISSGSGDLVTRFFGQISPRLGTGRF